MEILAATFNIPAEWLLTCFGALCSAIAFLFNQNNSNMQKRIDELKESYDTRIKDLEADISKLSSGCGFQGCLWRKK